MAKNTDILRLLFTVAVLFCVYSGGNVLRARSEEGLKDKADSIEGEGLKDNAQSLKEERLKGNAKNIAWGTENKAAKQGELLRRIYTAEIGITERTGQNDGSRVEEYLKYTGLKKGNPWCAAFVCWALGRAGLDNPRSGWSPDLFPDSKLIWKRGRFIKTQLLNPSGANQRIHRQGDVFGIYFANKGRIAHCGFVDTWNESWLLTVEGNTNEAGSREGEGVYKKRRLKSTVHMVANWAGHL